MTDQKPETKSDHVVAFRMPVPSKGKAERFATKRYLYEVRNLEEPSLLKVPGAAPKVLRASVVLRIFREDYARSDEQLARFDELTPGLEPALHELTHGTYNDNGKPLKIMVHGKPARMSAYVCDPAIKDGVTEFTEMLTMTELLQAASGDDRLDRMLRRGRAPLMGQRVDKHASGSGVDATTVDIRSEFRGWVFASKPGRPTVDYEKGTATFNSLGDVGYAVYLPLTTIRNMANLYFKLEPRWRSFIEEEHVIVEARQKDQALPRRLQLSAGRQAPKARAPKTETAPEAKAEGKPKRKAETADEKFARLTLELPEFERKAEAAKGTPDEAKAAKQLASAKSRLEKAKPPSEKQADTDDGGGPVAQA